MRKVILGAAMSLDGYIARADGSIDFLIMPETGSGGMADFFSGIDTIVFGRKTLDAGRAHSRGPMPSGPWTTYVFSLSEPPGERDGVVFIDQTPAAFVAELRDRPGKDIFHMGGGELARAFLEADLIDEIRVGLVPVLLGEGIPLFPSGFSQRAFSLVESKTSANGLLSVTYARERGD